MALIYKASLSPSKLELLTAWLPTRPWFSGDADLRQVAAYRFDDPAGEVGLEGFLIQAGSGPVMHAPLTYRSAPIPGADEHLVTTAEHSVLGTRWVYDGCGDPVWAAALAAAVVGGMPQAEEVVDVDGDLIPREATAKVTGSGQDSASVPELDTVSCYDDGPTTVIRAGSLELVVVRVIGAEVEGTDTLTGSWAGREPALLAAVRNSTANGG